MKAILLVLVMIAGAVSVHAQAPAADPDTIQNPVKQIDPEVKVLPVDVHYADESVRINADELPQPVLDNLKKMAPSGWNKSVVYKYIRENLFIVEIRESGNEKTLQFDRKGKLLSDSSRKNDDEK